MIAGAHFLLWTRDAEADRGFFKTVLEFPSVDLGDGWLIFALPHAQLAVHPGDGEFVQTHAKQPMLGGLLYRMCDDLGSVIGLLKSKVVTCANPVEAEWENQHQCSAADRRHDRSLSTDSPYDD